MHVPASIQGDHSNMMIMVIIIHLPVTFPEQAIKSKNKTKQNLPSSSNMQHEHTILKESRF